MAFFLYASFPNSRNRSRAPTRVAQTFQLEMPIVTDPPVVISEQSENRTSLTVTNDSLVDDMYYGYVTEGIIDPTVTPVFGLTNDLYFRTSTNTLYVKTDDGISTNWTVTTLDLVGYIIKPLQSFQVDALQTVRGLSASAVDTVLISVDEGRG